MMSQAQHSFSTRLATAGLGQKTRERFNLAPEYQDSGFELFFAGALDATDCIPAGSLTNAGGRTRPWNAHITRTARP